MSRVCELTVPTVPPEAARLVRGRAPHFWLVTLGAASRLHLCEAIPQAA